MNTQVTHASWQSPGRLIRKERPYQRRDKGAILASIAAHQCSLYVLPTAGGKTFVFGAVAKHFVDKTLRVCVVVHKTVLTDQTVKSIAESIGVPVSSVGTLINGQWTNPDAKVLVCMVQSLALKIERGECEHNFGLVILDEAHRSLAKTHRIVVDHFKAKQATILGVTATPERPDGVRMDEIYSDMVRGPSFAELTERGFIARPIYYAPTNDLLPVLKGAKKAGKDYVAKSLSTPCIAVVGGLVKQWERRAPKEGGTLIFAVDIAHAKAIAAEFRSQGVKSVEVATSHMKRADVLEVFARLKSGATKIVINVTIAVEGFDAPGISCLIIARPTMSKGLHIQMLGRALRKSCGCEFVCEHARPVILDHTINSLTLGKAEWYVAPGLDQEPEGPKYGTAAPGRACPDCGKITWSDGSSCGRCTECNYDFSDYDDPTRLVPSVDGDLVEMPDVAPERTPSHECMCGCGEFSGPSSYTQSKVLERRGREWTCKGFSSYLCSKWPENSLNELARRYREYREWCESVCVCGCGKSPHPGTPESERKSPHMCHKASEWDAFCSRAGESPSREEWLLFGAIKRLGFPAIHLRKSDLLSVAGRLPRVEFNETPMSRTAVKKIRLWVKAHPKMAARCAREVATFLRSRDFAAIEAVRRGLPEDK